MSPGGVHYDEMPHPVDPAFEPGGPLATFADDVRMVVGGPAPEPRPGLLAVMGGGVLPTTGTTRRKPMLVKTLLGSLAAKLAMGIGLATATVTAAGAAGVLPAAAQHAVATVVGATTPFQLPDSSGRPAGTVRASDDPGEATTTTSVHPTTTTSTAPSTTVVGGGGVNGARQDNHGACVSAVAHDQSQTGEDHGKAVSAAAQSDCGKGPVPTSTTVVRPTTTSTSTTLIGTSADKARDEKAGTDDKGGSASKGASGNGKDK